VNQKNVPLTNTSPENEEDYDTIVVIEVKENKGDFGIRKPFDRLKYYYPPPPIPKPDQTNSLSLYDIP